MNKEFEQWLTQQKYDWDVLYNQRHGTVRNNRRWMLSCVFKNYLIHTRGAIDYNITYNWDELT